jgi:hypothetical protein
MLFSNYLFVQPKFLCVLNGVPHHCHIGTYKSLRNMTNCIWCTEATEDLAEEHIIPDAIGCPYDLILRNGEVCKSCNNRLGHLDRAVADEFDMVAFNENVPRKDGKAAAIRSRGNVVATRSPTGSVMTINMEKRSVKAHDGTTVGAYGKSTRNNGCLNNTVKMAGLCLVLHVDQQWEAAAQTSACVANFDPHKTLTAHGFLLYVLNTP